MQAFDYVLAQSVEQVTSLLMQHGGDARILNGGTDLIVQMREGHRWASLLVDIKQLPEVNKLIYDAGDGLQIGAAVSCLRISSHVAVIKNYPGLLDAILIIGGVQIQGRATLGGNLCNASPAADGIPALIAHNAVCVIAGPDGRREVAVENFCTAPGETVLRQGEFLISLHIPPPEPRSGAAYSRFTPRNEMDMAVVGVGVRVVLDKKGKHITSARIALGGVAPIPLFVPTAGDVLVGMEINNEAIEEAARLARDATRPISDLRGTVTQRKHLAFVLTQRVLKRAVERARETVGRE